MQDYGLQCRKFIEINDFELDREIKKMNFHQTPQKILLKELLHGKDITMTKMRG